MEEVPAPRAGRGEVVLQVSYAGLNPADRYLAERLYPARPELPHIMGRDGVGTVVEVGEGVTSARVGDRRAMLRGETGVNRPGTFAERVAVPEQDLIEMPAGWSEEQSAGSALVYVTAWQALTMWGPLPAGAIVLITGASGGVGVASVHLALAMGFKVIALSRGEAKRQRLKELGATAVYDPENGHWFGDLKTEFKPRRVDLAIDNVGGKLLPQVIDTLGEHGRVSLVGRLSGTVPDFNTATLFFRRLRLGGVAASAYTNEESRAAWNDVVRVMGQANFKPIVDRVFPFEDLIPAFEHLARGPFGKVLLRVAAEKT